MRQRIVAMLIGILIVCLSIWLEISRNPTAHLYVTTIDNIFYKEQIKKRRQWGIPRHLSVPIAIIDIDEKSLVEQGPWPWPRSRFAELVTILQQSGVRVIAFNFIFSATENTPATDYLKKLDSEQQNNPELTNVLNRIIYLYEGDEYLAKAAANEHSVLGMSFNDIPQYSKGKLPKPEFIIPPGFKLLIPEFTGYIANYSLLEDSAKNAGFVSGISDEDGIVRNTPLFIVYKDGIYLSLALAVAKEYLNIPKIEIELLPVRGKYFVNKVLLGKRVILTNASGIMKIPYLNDKAFAKFSATDILKKRIPKALLQNKIVLIGSTSFSVGDRSPTPFESFYPSIMIQANVIAALLNGNNPYTPGWSKGVEIAFIAFIGLTLAFLLPFMRAISSITVLLVTMSGIFFGYVWLWTNYNMVFSITPALLVVFNLVTFNLIYGYLFVSRKLVSIFNLFSHYVPPEHVKKISDERDQSVHGEIRRSVILFADIRNFTGVSERLAIKELTSFLNLFFDGMSQIIQDHKGTIDKFIGDEIMAFWEIKDDEKLQNQNAIEAGLDMQKKISELRKVYKKYNFSLRIGVGINTGEVYLGDLGSDIRRSYTVIGDTVNATSRIESLTKHYRCNIIVGEATYETSQDDYVFRYLDKIQVKGKTVPVRIFELICKKEQASAELYAELEEYDQALSLYYQRDWARAGSAFLNLIKKYPHVKIYSILYKRSKEYTQEPPPDDWDMTYFRLHK